MVSFRKIIAVVLLLTTGVLTARDMQTLNGQLFKNVVVTKVEPNGIRITHDSGAGFLDFMVLPLEVRKEFGYSQEAYLNHGEQLQQEKLAKAQKEKAEAERKLAEVTRKNSEVVEQVLDVVSVTQVRATPTPKPSSDWYNTALNRAPGDLSVYVPPQRSRNYEERDYTDTQVSSTRYTDRASSGSSSGVVHVKGYYRKNGTYVQPHTRSRPRR